MTLEQVKEKIRENETKSTDLKTIYVRSLLEFSGCGTYINSKTIKDNGFHLLSISNEMQKLEIETNMLNEFLKNSRVHKKEYTNKKIS